LGSFVLAVRRNRCWPSIRSVVSRYLSEWAVHIFWELGRRSKGMEARPCESRDTSNVGGRNSKNGHSFQDSTLIRPTQSGNAIQHLGQISLKSSQRVSHIQFHPTRDFVCLQSQDRSIEVFRIRSDDEIRKKFAKRKKRRKEKAAAEGQAEEQEDVEEPANFTLEDILSPYYVLRPSGKVRSFSFIKDKLGRTPDHLTVRFVLSTSVI
jgi:hypothetical protein